MCPVERATISPDTTQKDRSSELACTVARSRGAVEFDAAIRDMTRIDGEAYLHRQLVSLPMVDLRTARDRGQLDLFDDVSDGECGAFTCMAEPA